MAGRGRTKTLTGDSRSVVKCPVYLATISPIEASKQFENFIANSSKLVCHGDDGVDFKTIRAWLSRNSFSLSEFNRIQHLNSSLPFKHFMWTDRESNKTGMRTIVKEYGSKELYSYYEANAHSALGDAMTLCRLITSKKMYSRFFSFSALDTRFGGPRANYSMRYMPY